MATTLSLTTTYAGAVAGEYIHAAFLSAESLNAITVKENVPYKLKVQRLTDSATTFGGNTCTFTPTGTVSVDERTLTLADLSLQRELCKTSFYHDWEALAAQNGDITKVADALVMTMGGVIGQIMETKIWQGTAGTGSFDGLQTLFEASGSGVIDAGGVEITEDNVLDTFKAVVSALPVRVRRAAEKPVLFVSSDVAEFYRNAIPHIGAGAYLPQGVEVVMKWNGQYDIIECPGMKDQSIVFAQKSNLWFGTNKVSDQNNISVIDMEPVNADKTVRFAATFFAGVQFGFGNEIAYYNYSA